MPNHLIQRGSRTQDLSGMQFGDWVVLNVGTRISKRHSLYWLCRCKCGNEKEVRGTALRQGRTKGCGCEQRARISQQSLKHGWSGQREYRRWKAMIRRCHCPKCPEYKRYGAKGIVVCERWRNSYLAFVEDMGPAPSASHQIDRLNNNRGYEPDNVRWATRTEQARNQSNNRVITWRGRSLTLAEWAERTGIGSSTIAQRLNHGWHLDDALTAAPTSVKKCAEEIRRLRTLLRANGIDPDTGRR